MTWPQSARKLQCRGRKAIGIPARHGEFLIDTVGSILPSLSSPFATSSSQLDRPWVSRPFGILKTHVRPEAVASAASPTTSHSQFS